MSAPKLDFDRQKLQWRWQSEDVKAATFSLWRDAFPQVDIAAEMAKMKVWIISNPNKSHKRNWLRFCSNWLSHAAKPRFSPWRNAEEQCVNISTAPAAAVACDREFEERW